MRNSFKFFIFIVVFFIISFLVIESLIILEGSKSYEKESDYLFILGARLYGDRPSPALLERLKVARDYLNNHKDTSVVATGGQGSDELISEAQAIKNYLLENGIRESRIILEDESVNTFQNIKFGLEKIRQVDDSRHIEILVATNKFHIFRSKLIAKRLGVKAYGLPAKVPPTIFLQSYIREYFAIIKTLLLDK